MEKNDRVTHTMQLNDKIDIEETLNKYQFDDNFLKNEESWNNIRKSILGITDEDSNNGSSDDDDSSSDSDDGSTGDDEGSDSDDDDDDDLPPAMNLNDAGPSKTTDLTGADLVDLRRKIYLVIMSSLDYEECAHKLLMLRIPKANQIEICTMLLECCSQERTYVKMYGLLGCRFCSVDALYQTNFKICFVQQYNTCHHLDTNKLRNTAKFFAHLICHDALPWDTMSCITLTEKMTTSSGRIFIKILFQEML